MADDQGVPKPRGRKPVVWRKDPAILARMREVERLYHEKRSNVAIAAELGVDEVTVRRDLARLQELWQEYAGLDIAERRGRRIAQLEHIAALGLQYAAFDETAERAVLLGETMAGADGQTHFVQRDAKMSAQFRGNKAAALQAARQAVMDAAKLEGLVVDKVAPTDGDGNPLTLAALIMAARTQRADEDGGGGDGGIIDGHLAG